VAHAAAMRNAELEQVILANLDDPAESRYVSVGE
jgi:hypothetical protein